jgi:plastocyanin
VVVLGYNFNPATITVRAGTRVFWMNQDMVDHTATSDVSGIFDVYLPAGGSNSVTFTVPGKYPYHCAIHPEMLGMVIVI